MLEKGKHKGGENMDDNILDFVGVTTEAEKKNIRKKTSSDNKDKTNHYEIGYTVNLVITKDGKRIGIDDLPSDVKDVLMKKVSIFDEIMQSQFWNDLLK